MKIKKKGRLRIGLICLLIFGSLTMLPVSGSTGVQAHTSYVYTQDGEDVEIPDVYTIDREIFLQDAEGTVANEPCDMSLAADGTIVIADTGNNRILLLNNTGDLTALSTFIAADGEQMSLNEPEGIFACTDGTLLIADTQNGRILHVDRNGSLLKQYGRPDMLGVDSEPYLPIKIAQDSYGRLYIVARNINRGIICLDPEGLFVGYVGAPRVVPDIWELLWRRISTKAQKEQMTQYASTEYNNVFVDEKNFVWGTISALDAADILGAVQNHDTSGQITPVVKINAGNTDVLRRNGSYAPLGDLRFDDEPSRIVDVALGLGGTYSLLDFQRGRVFTYDENGELLYAFGGLGDGYGNLHAPVAMFYQNEKLCILDRTRGSILIYKPTDYGRLVLEAVAAQHSGDFDNSYRLWAKVAEANSNFEYAFIGMGNVCISNKDYQTALKYFQYANDMESYSNTFELLRKQYMASAFSYIFFGLSALLVIVIVTKIAVRVIRYVKGEKVE